jgi:hypothetical protein
VARTVIGDKFQDWLRTVRPSDEPREARELRLPALGAEFLQAQCLHRFDPRAFKRGDEVARVRGLAEAEQQQQLHVVGPQLVEMIADRSRERLDLDRLVDRVEDQQRTIDQTAGAVPCRAIRAPDPSLDRALEVRASGIKVERHERVVLPGRALERGRKRERRLALARVRLQQVHLGRFAAEAAQQLLRVERVPGAGAHAERGPQGIHLTP